MSTLGAKGAWRRLSSRLRASGWEPTLLTKFGVSGLLLFVVLGGVLGQALASSMRDRVLEEAHAKAEMIAGLGIQPLLSDSELARGLTDDRRAALGNSLSVALAKQDLVYTEILNRDAVVVYSDEALRVGRVHPASPELRAALHSGESTSRLTDRDPVTGDPRQLLEVTVPLRRGPTALSYGAFRLHVPYEPVERDIARSVTRLYVVLTVCLLALFTAMFRLMARASRRIREQADEMKHSALHDVLTELPNRALFRDRLEQALTASRRRGDAVAVMLMDIDRFKEVNDALGHHHGDLLLRQIADRLQGCVRGQDTVARLGGDEFAVVVPDTTAAEADAVARRLRDAFAPLFTVEGIRLQIGVSVGIALSGEDAPDADTLVKHADVAMYSAKSRHSGQEFYAAEDDQRSPRQLALSAELRGAIDRGELVLHYQPKVDLATGHVQGVEALVRWSHPVHGLLGPHEFVPIAERTSLIDPLTSFVIDEALRHCRLWHDAGRPLQVSVNVSGRSLHDPAFPAAVGELLTKRSVAPAWLQLEITEETVVGDGPHVRSVLHGLRAMGVTLSIDDFGTGYSSLSQVRRLPVQELKIDRSFIADLAADDDPGVISFTINLARSLGLRVVAEGVEDVEVATQLAALGCDLAQGYLFSRPLPEDELVRWLTSRDRAPDPHGRYRVSSAV